MPGPPPKKFSRVKIIGGVLAAALLLGGLGVNFHIAGNRTLYIVNGYAAPVTVQIDGETPVTLAHTYPVPLPLGEGRHHAVFSGAVTGEFDFDMHAEFFQRFY